jgi:hypothetical protein
VASLIAILNIVDSGAEPLFGVFLAFFGSTTSSMWRRAVFNNALAGIGPVAAQEFTWGWERDRWSAARRSSSAA